jgi:hypothetical protein
MRTAITCRTRAIKYYYRDQERIIPTEHTKRIERIPTPLKLGKMKRLWQNTNIRGILTF